MNILVFDTETPTKNNGHPYTPGNGIILDGYYFHAADYEEYMESPEPWLISRMIQEADIIVMFNAKFDLAHVRKQYGIHIYNKQIWDCQLAFFLMTNQQHRFPSLNQALEHHGLEAKLDVVKEEYWSKGIDTADVPKDILSAYLRQDVMQTYALFKAQWEQSGDKRQLIKLSCWDTLALHEMEWNGMAYDVAGSRAEGDRLKAEVDRMERELSELIGLEINWSSRDQLSAVLFGGEIEREETEEYLFTYKDPKKKPVMKTRKVIKSTTLPMLCKPGKETAKKGVYEVNEAALKNLKAKGKAGKIIALVQERAKLSKLVGTYLHGLPAMMEKMEWESSLIHGQLNQCVAVTSRLSSEKPNLQNIDPKTKKFFVSRFQD